MEHALEAADELVVDAGAARFLFRCAGMGEVTVVVTPVPTGSS
jgi:hypothetical protein